METIDELKQRIADLEAEKANTVEKRNAYAREYYHANKEKLRKRNAKYQAENRDLLNAKKRERYKANIAKERERTAKYQAANREKINARKRANQAKYYAAKKAKYRETHPIKPKLTEDKNAYARAYYHANKESILAKQRAKYKADKEQMDAS